MIWKRAGNKNFDSERASGFEEQYLYIKAALLYFQTLCNYFNFYSIILQLLLIII